MPSVASPPEWPALVAAARGGSADALGIILDAVRPYLLTVAADRLDDDLRAKGDASDLVQQSLLEAYRDFAGFHGDRPDQLRAWLRRVLLNNVANFRRAFRDADCRAAIREQPLPDTGDGRPGDQLANDSSGAFDRLERIEQFERVTRAVERLPERQRNVVEWHYRDGLSFAEIGVRLGRTAEGARQIWWRALQRLRVELHELG